MPDVFFRKFLSRCQGESLLFLDSLAGAHGLLDKVHRVDRVDCGRSRGLQGVIDDLDMPKELR
jgi:hypothetical protein